MLTAIMFREFNSVDECLTGVGFTYASFTPAFTCYIESNSTSIYGAMVTTCGGKCVII
jgi:hypothetical protein